VVLPDGELLRTGMGAIPGAKTWQQYKSGCGPWVDGIFSQGNYGIVTKMGFWLMPEPEAFLRCTVRVPRYKDLIPLVDTLNYLENSRIVTGFPDLATPLLGYPPTGQVQLYIEGTAAYPMSEEHKALLAKADQGYSPALEAYGIAHDIPYWELWVSYYGPPEVIDAQWQASQRRFAQIPGAQFKVIDRLTMPVDLTKIDDYHEPELGVPSLRARPTTPAPPRGTCGSHRSSPARARRSSRPTGYSAQRQRNWACPCSRPFQCPPVSGNARLSSFWPRRSPPTLPPTASTSPASRS
jgi:4-cresol dehydrogenase (hydroxylating)